MVFSLFWILLVLSGATAAGCRPESCDCGSYVIVMGEQPLSVEWFSTLGSTERGFTPLAFYSLFGAPTPTAFLSAKLVQGAMLGAAWGAFAASFAGRLGSPLARLIASSLILSLAWQGGTEYLATDIGSDGIGLLLVLLSLSVFVSWNEIVERAASLQKNFRASVWLILPVAAFSLVLLACKAREANSLLLLFCLPLLATPFLSGKTGRVPAGLRSLFLASVVGAMYVGWPSSPWFAKVNMGHVMASVGLSDPVAKTAFPPLMDVEWKGPMLDGENVHAFVTRDEGKAVSSKEYGPHFGGGWKGDFANPMFRRRPDLVSYARTEARRDWAVFLATNPKWLLGKTWENRRLAFMLPLPGTERLYPFNSAVWLSIAAVSLFAWAILRGGGEACGVAAAGGVLMTAGLANVMANFWFDIWAYGEIIRHVGVARTILSAGCILIIAWSLERCASLFSPHVGKPVGSHNGRNSDFPESRHLSVATSIPNQVPSQETSSIH